jgi:hypothetical protein
VTAEIHFMEDHPISPPVVRLVRPRMRPGTGSVRNGGTIDLRMVARDNWIPGAAARSVCLCAGVLTAGAGYEIRAVLLSARDALVRPPAIGRRGGKHGSDVGGAD